MNGKQSAFDGRHSQPRNLQAALIFTKAKPFHLPPVPEPKPVFAETAKQKHERWQRELQERLKEHARITAIKDAEIERKKKQEAAKVAARLKRQKNNPRNLWMRKHLKRMAAISGKPKPSEEEIKAARSAYKAGQIRI